MFSLVSNMQTLFVSWCGGTYLEIWKRKFTFHCYLLAKIFAVQKLEQIEMHVLFNLAHRNCLFNCTMATGFCSHPLYIIGYVFQTVYIYNLHEICCVKPFGEIFINGENYYKYYNLFLFVLILLSDQWFRKCIVIIPIYFISRAYLVITLVNRD